MIEKISRWGFSLLAFVSFIVFTWVPVFLPYSSFEDPYELRMALRMTTLFTMMIFGFIASAMWGRRLGKVDFTNNKGFTLVELMVLLFIVGMIVLVGFVAFHFISKVW